MSVSEKIEEFTNKINSFDIREDAKKFINTRTNLTFQSQFIFYYNLSNDYDRAFIRATEETLAIEREEEYYTRTNLLSILNDTEIDNEEKINLMKKQLS